MLVEIRIVNKEEVTVITSIDVAETFGKEHKRVLQDIRELRCSEEFGKHGSCMENQDYQWNCYYVFRTGGLRMSNLEIKEFSQAITNFVDSSGLPEEVKRMALQDILIKQERRAEEELLMEIAVRDALEKKQKEEKGEEQNAESV